MSNPTGGPLPARNAQRKQAKRGKAAMADVVESFSRYPVPPPKGNWEPETIAWYLSLDQSGQSRWYEPTDWQFALVVGDMLDDFYAFADRRPSADKMKVMFDGMTKLGCTENDRRRMRVEVHRPDPLEGADEDAEADAAVDATLLLLPGGN